MLLTFSDPICFTASVWCSDMPLSVLSVLVCASPTLPPSQPHNGPLRQTTHANTYIHPAWHIRAEVILPWHAGGNQCHIALCTACPTTLQMRLLKWSDLCSYTGLLSTLPFCPHYAAPIILSSQGSKPKQTLNFSCFVISCAATEQPTNTCLHIDLVSAAAWL